MCNCIKHILTCSKNNITHPFKCTIRVQTNLSILQREATRKIKFPRDDRPLLTAGGFHGK